MRGAANLAAAKAATENAIPDLLARVESSELPLLVLQEIIARPAQVLRPTKNQLIGLLASTSARTREIIMSSLIRGGWRGGWIEPAQDKT